VSLEQRIFLSEFLRLYMEFLALMLKKCLIVNVYIKHFFEYEFCKIMNEMGLFTIILRYNSANISPQIRYFEYDAYIWINKML